LAVLLASSCEPQQLCRMPAVLLLLLLLQRLQEL
jgi:hypothetical protein